VEGSDGCVEEGIIVQLILIRGSTECMLILLLVMVMMSYDQMIRYMMNLLLVEFIRYTLQLAGYECWTHYLTECDSCR
jgi:hypothetical protein